MDLMKQWLPVFAARLAGIYLAVGAVSFISLQVGLGLFEELYGTIFSALVIGAGVFAYRFIRFRRLSLELPALASELGQTLPELLVVGAAIIAAIGLFFLPGLVGFSIITALLVATRTLQVPWFEPIAVIAGAFLISVATFNLAAQEIQDAEDLAAAYEELQSPYKSANRLALRVAFAAVGVLIGNGLGRTLNRWLPNFAQERRASASNW